MGRRTIGTLILLATLSVIGVVLTQFFWLDNAYRVQHARAELQQTQAAQMEKQFNDRVTMALTTVTEEILSINKDPSDLFDAVKQERPNYFAVTINDTLHPYLLEALLRREFARRNIKEDFEYGIYDCFTDSVVYGAYVSLTDSIDTDTVQRSRLLKLNKDGHYFGVYFPGRTSSLWDVEPGTMTPWFFPALVTLIVFIFFAYSVWIILKQKRLNEIKNDFIGNMTHELKTPISTIALSSEVLSDPAIVNEPERLASYAGIIRAENQRLKDQVERVLQLATLDKEGVELEREPVDMHDLIEGSISSMQLSVKEKGGHISFTPEARGSFVMGDAMHLGNMVQNLLDNAVKYCTKAPEIVIRTLEDGGNLHLIMSDNGIGIAKEDQRHIFERFYRVPTGNVHDVKGFGLGLHYVKYIVEAHGGRIQVESHPGKGSTFRIQLPLLKDR